MCLWYDNVYDDIYNKYIYTYIYVCMYMSTTDKMLKTSWSKMHITYDVCDVHWASSYYIKTCWQSSFIYVYV